MFPKVQELPKNSLKDFSKQLVNYPLNIFLWNFITMSHVSFKWLQKKFRNWKLDGKCTYCLHTFCDIESY